MRKNKKCQGDRRDIDLFIKNVVRERVQTKCKVSCKMMKFKSRFSGQLQSINPRIRIFLDPTVTEWNAEFSWTPSFLMVVMEALGSAMGLWLGVGIVQMGQVLEKVLGKIMDRIKRGITGGRKELSNLEYTTFESETVPKDNTNIINPTV